MDLWKEVLDVPYTDTCVEWQHSLISGPRNYGWVRYGGKNWLTHRLSFHLHKGPIPSGLHVCHRCDNDRCYNPRHLFAGSRSDNMRDCLKKGRMFTPRGEASGRAILTSEEVRTIRSIYKPHTRGLGYKSLARRYGVAWSTMRAVLSGASWKHL